MSVSLKYLLVFLKKKKKNCVFKVLLSHNQYHTRTLCSLPNAVITNELDNQVSFKITLLSAHCLSLQVLVEGKAWSRIVILNRHSVLNCLSIAMVCVLTGWSFLFLCVCLLGYWVVTQCVNIGSVERFVIWVFVFMVFDWENTPTS